MGTSVTANVGDIDENIREGKSRSMRKELVGLYYLSHISSDLSLSNILVVSARIFHGVHMVNSSVEVSSETPIHVLTILFHLSVSPPYNWHLMMVWKY